MRRSIGIKIIGVLLLLVLVGLFVPHMSYERRHHVISLGNMRRIATAIVAYQADHGGEPPAVLSALYPRYEPNMQAFLFGFSDTNYPAFQNLSVPESLIDLFSPYSFMRLKDGRILVLERPGFWKNGKISYFILGKPPGPMSNIYSGFITPIEFERRLSNGFPDFPDNPDYQELFSTRIGSHEYELRYTGKELQKINEAFKTSGRAPISSDNARAKVQAAMTPPGSSATWGVDQGTLTSDGATPYFIFQCHYIESGRNTGESLGVMVLLDGSLYIPTQKD